MRIVCGLSLCFLSCLSLACRSTPTANQTSPRAAIGSVEHFGVQFTGEYHLAEMAGYQLMILDPDQAGAHDADSIVQRGNFPIAYLNIGEAESYRWFYRDIHQEWILASNPNWKDHFYLDVNNTGWHSLLMKKVLPAIFQKGFDGIFLDMVDVASPELYPTLQPGVIALIREIREEYPEKIIIMNNGTFLAGAVNDLIDGIVVESVFTSYDFTSKTYVRQRDEDSHARCAELHTLVKTLGVKIFAIDYAPPGDTLTARTAANRSHEQGFLSFVSTIELDTLPKPLN
jgi:polysaccharide biosynthesis protein PelA